MQGLTLDEGSQLFGVDSKALWLIDMKQIVNSNFLDAFGDKNHHEQASKKKN